MSNVGAVSGAQKVFDNPAKYLGTGPTEIEKKAAKAIIETASNVAKEVTDAVSDMAATSEGKAITSGLFLKAVAPFSLLGDALIMGGAAVAAKKYIENQYFKP